ncbi:MAG: GAF domain-containing protein [Paraglaciecola sp.]|uniref:GAF domain-containing protein n=1 Tax=Flavobacterium sp. W21_SRS_FM6 TaxID=3240268 RepID=UPI0027552DC7|nr:GAF domain-containing protein [Paraglaciecola sp.]MDP5134193.1 GAF domain-containing protein [Paraglaciecola sp.]
MLDTAPEARFDYITKKVKKYFDVSYVLVTIIDKERQWFKSCQGIELSETSRDISFCGHAINYNNIFYVPNALADERFFDNPLVLNEPYVRFYAGVPLIIFGEYAIGTLCLIDDQPRVLSDADLDMLQEFANMVIFEIEQREVERAKHP